MDGVMVPPQVFGGGETARTEGAVVWLGVGFGVAFEVTGYSESFGTAWRGTCVR